MKKEVEIKIEGGFRNALVSIEFESFLLKIEDNAFKGKNTVELEPPFIDFLGRFRGRHFSSVEVSIAIDGVTKKLPKKFITDGVLTITEQLSFSDFNLPISENLLHIIS